MCNAIIICRRLKLCEAIINNFSSTVFIGHRMQMIYAFLKRREKVIFGRLKIKCKMNSTFNRRNHSNAPAATSSTITIRRASLTFLRWMNLFIYFLISVLFPFFSWNKNLFLKNQLNLTWEYRLINFNSNWNALMAIREWQCKGVVHLTWMTQILHKYHIVYIWMTMNN